MGQIIVKPPFDINADFWKYNFPISLIKPYNKIYELKHGSKIMWCYWLYHDPTRYNSLYHKTHDVKLKAIKEYCKEFKLTNALIKKGFDSFPMLLLTAAAREFAISQDNIVKRNTMITKLRNYFDELEIEELKDKDTQNLLAKLEKMEVDSVKYYESFDKLKMIFNKEDEEIEIFGGGEETLLDKGGLIDLDD